VRVALDAAGIRGVVTRVRTFLRRRRRPAAACRAAAAGAAAGARAALVAGTSGRKPNRQTTCGLMTMSNSRWRCRCSCCLCSMNHWPVCTVSGSCSTAFATTIRSTSFGPRRIRPSRVPRRMQPRSLLSCTVSCLLLPDVNDCVARNSVTEGSDARRMPRENVQRPLDENASSADGRTSALSTVRICFNAYSFSSGVFDAMQSAGTTSLRSRM